MGGPKYFVYIFLGPRWTKEEATTGIFGSAIGGAAKCTQLTAMGGCYR